MQALLVVLCLAFEVNARYSTYRQYASCLPEENLGSYRVWNRGEGRWEEAEAGELRVGQVVIVEKYLESNGKLNPANLLPLAFASGSKYAPRHAEACSFAPPASTSARSS